MIQNHSQVSPDLVKGMRDKMNILKLQAEGKIAAAVPRSVVEKALKYIQSHPKAQIRVHRNGGKVGLWVTNTDYDYLLGQNKKGTLTLNAVDTANNGCYDPITVKTMGHDVWVACDEGPNYEGGAEQEYSSSGSVVATFNPTAGGCSGSETCYSYAFDGASDGNGGAFIEQSEAYTFYCTSYYCYFEYLSPGVSHMSSPSATPTFISLGGYANPAYYMYYMGLDSSGNIYFDYEGEQNSQCCFGVGEISNPLSNPQVHFILPPGTLEFAGGVSVTSNNRLWVTDQEARLTYEYALPLTSSSTPLATFGPTATGIAGYGDPVAGGWNSPISTLVQGDAYGWLDVTTAANVNTAVVNIDDLPSLEGAAYSKSNQP
jgi:hypothetical protein